MSAQPPQRTRVEEQLGAGETVEKPEFVGQNADGAFGLHRVLPGVDAVDVNPPCVRA